MRGSHFVIEPRSYFKNLTHLDIPGTGVDIRKITYPSNLKVLKFFWYVGIDLNKLPVLQTTKIGIRFPVNTYDINHIKTYNLHKACWVDVYDDRKKFVCDLSLMLGCKTLVCERIWITTLIPPPSLEKIVCNNITYKIIPKQILSVKLRMDLQNLNEFRNMFDNCPNVKEIKVIAIGALRKNGLVFHSAESFKKYFQ